MTPQHILVLMGGWSAERAVSLVSGAGIADALERLGHRVTRLDMGRDVAAQLAHHRPDLVFNALHGTPGEDGTVQGLLELMGQRYTHSGPAASAIAIDKVLTKRLLTPLGIPMPPHVVLTPADLARGDPLPRPYVLKPINEGSSVGVMIVTDHTPAHAQYPHMPADRPFMAEPFIPGRELTVAVLDGQPLAVTELTPTRGFYDYDAKYTDGLTTHVCPAAIPAPIAARAMAIAAQAHAALGCRGVTRSDFRWDDSRDLAGLYLLEINTQPGMTPLSLVPEQARATGMSYDQLVQRIVDSAPESRA